MFEAEDVSLHELESESRALRYRHDGTEVELVCDVVAGCDGYHGTCRDSIPDGVLSLSRATTPSAGSGSSRRRRLRARS